MGGEGRGGKERRLEGRRGIEGTNRSVMGVAERKEEERRDSPLRKHCQGRGFLCKT